MRIGKRINHGRYDIWLLKDKKPVKKYVYEMNGRYYVKWYGKRVEVIHGICGYAAIGGW